MASIGESVRAMAHPLAQRPPVLGLLVALLLIGVVVSTGVGAVSLSPGQVLALLARPLGLELPWAVEPGDAAVFFSIRLPRVLLAVLVGASLASSGAALQGLFRNPLADPGLVGVSSGAALGAVAVIVLGDRLGVPAAVRAWLLPGAAFAGGLVTTMLVLRLGRIEGRTSVVALLLAGVAVTALASAATGLVLFVADDAQLRSATFWSMGSLGNATWGMLTAVAAPMLLAILALPRLAGALDLLLLGEAEARHSGVRVERVKLAVIVLVSLGVGAAVAVSGVIGFVGLLAPHLVRLWAGPGHRVLLPGAALVGAVLLLLADATARTMVAPAELPIGILTALAGAPLLLVLLGRAVRGEGQP